MVAGGGRLPIPSNLPSLGNGPDRHQKTQLSWYLGLMADKVPKRTSGNSLTPPSSILSRVLELLELPHPVLPVACCHRTPLSLGCRGECSLPPMLRDLWGGQSRLFLLTRHLPSPTCTPTFLVTYINTTFDKPTKLH